VLEWASQQKSVTLVNAISLNALHHGLDAQRAGHDRIHPKVARKEPILRVYGLLTSDVSMAVDTRVWNERHRVKELALLRPSSKPRRPWGVRKELGTIVFHVEVNGRSELRLKAN